MNGKAVAGLALGAAGVLAFGVWLGGQRASADHATRVPAAPAANERPTPVERAARVPTLRLSSKPTAPGLAEDLRDADPKVRRNAITEVREARTLVDASRDPDLNVAVAATEGLAALYREGQVSAAELVARLDGNAPSKVRVAAINGLGLVASPESASALSELLARGSEIDRRSAAIVMMHQDPAVAVPALIGALRDSDANVRMNAREALRTIARGRDLGDDDDAWQRWWQARAR